MFRRIVDAFTSLRFRTWMKIVILQSNYLPWKGYFDLMHDADVFVFFDETQYPRRSLRNRNKVYGKNGIHWLTVPVSSVASRGKISEVAVSSDKWQVDHLKTLTSVYGRAPYFSQLRVLMSEFYEERAWGKLVEINHFSLLRIAKELRLQTRFVHSSELRMVGNRVTRLIDMVKELGGSQYITGPSARNYLEGSEHLFRSEGIELSYKDYSGYPEYPQLQAPFEHQVSIVDMIANLNWKDIPYHIWGWREETRSGS